MVTLTCKGGGLVPAEEGADAAVVDGVGAGERRRNLMSLYDVVDLQLAVKRVWDDKRDDAWPDILGYHDFRRQFEKNESTIRACLENPTTYEASRAHSIDIPKRGFTLRPGIIPCIRDRVIYQAVADLLAPSFEMEASVLSNRLVGPKSTRMFEQGVKLWKTFQDEIEDLCADHQYVVETDIAAYFEHIYHRLLYDRLREIFCERFDEETIKETITLLKRLFGRWKGNTLSGFGIPQMSDPSSFFGNLYLDEVDKWLKAHGYVFRRYVDDVRVFTTTEPEARKALSELVTKMRRIGLYVSSAKTRIRRAEEVVKELVGRREQVGQFEAAFGSRQRDQVEAIVGPFQELFASLVADPAHDDRLFRYCVNRAKRLSAWGIGEESFYEWCIDRIIDQLSSMPHCTDVFTDFLSLFPDHVRIHDAVLDFIGDPYSIYPWQQMHLLELLIRCDIVGHAKDRAVQSACALLSQKSHPACRAKAVILQGKNGTYADRRDIRELYPIDENIHVRRAILVGVQELDSDLRQMFYREVDSESLEISCTVDYLNSLQEPVYHYYNPPQFPELINDESDDLYDLGSDYFL